MHHTGNDTKFKEHTDPFIQCEFDKYHTHTEWCTEHDLLRVEKCVSV